MEDNNFKINNDEKTEDNLDYEEWTKFISYYRYYLDEFAVDIPFSKIDVKSNG